MLASVQDSEALDGTVWVQGERRIVRFNRHYDVTPARLWVGITQPELVAGWLGPVEKFELAPGGDVVVLLHPKNGAWLRGKVLQIAIPRMIELSWTVPAHGTAPTFCGSTLRLEVHAEGAGSRLSFAHSLPDATRVLDILAAFHLRLRQLPSAVGQEARVDREEFLAMRSRYERASADKPSNDARMND